MACQNPIQLLQIEALKLSGLSYDRAFAIDDFDIKSQFGEMNVSKLVEVFYNKVYADKNESFRYFKFFV
jgi:hypothetical protein